MNKLTRPRLLLSAALVVLLAVALGGGTAVGRNLVSSQAPVVSPLQVSASEFPISFQGIVTHDQGTPVADGIHQITFSIYDGPAATSPLWQETQSVATSGGLFSVLLGANTPITPSLATDNPETYLGVRIGSDAEMIPRIRLAYTPYALHSLTSGDTDTLDGLDSSDFALKGQAQSGGPPGFASSFSPFSITSVDTGNQVGLFTSIAIGIDGLPVISYLSDTSRDLKLAHCSDAACSEASITTVDSGGAVGRYSSIAIGADGLPIISYYAETGNDLKVAHCTNVVCTRSEITLLDTGGTVGLFTSIAIGDDDRPIISYLDDSEGDLKVAKCDDIECSEADLNTVDDSEDVGRFTAIAIGIDGLPIISYFDDENDNLKVAHCDDDDCDGVDIETVDSSGNVGEFTSIAIGTDGLPIISYYDNTSDNLKVAHCSNQDCSSANITTLDSVGNVGQHSSITIGVDGLPIISYFDETFGDLKIAHCNDVRCTSTARIMTVDRVGKVGEYTSITTGADGLPVISYFQDATGDLKVLHCARVGCRIP